jgi:hypothetical protein
LRVLFALPLLSSLGLLLSAQTVPAPAAAGPAIKWRGALWASGAISDRQTGDGSMLLRGMDAGDGHFALDALQLGADVNLVDGWSLKFTALAGQTAKVINATSLESGSVAFTEAMLVWTGAQDTLRFGRMYTAMGMEVVDHTQDLTASRGLLFTYALPFGQVGLNWHHAFSPVWSADLYLYNGEDRIKDNNRGKTAGLGLTWNHAGATDKFITVMAYSGAEQDGTGSAAGTGAEGRKRERLCLSGGWAWGPVTLLWEGEAAREALTATSVLGSTGRGNVTANWSGFGVIGKYQISEPWSLVVRAEVLKDDTGLRLAGDPSVALAVPVRLHADLQASSVALGVERRWHATFSRLEVRQDSLNHDLHEAAAAGAKAFRSGTSLTWSLGTSF